MQSLAHSAKQPAASRTSPRMGYQSRGLTICILSAVCSECADKIKKKKKKGERKTEQKGKE